MFKLASMMGIANTRGVECYLGEETAIPSLQTSTIMWNRFDPRSCDISSIAASNDSIIWSMFVKMESIWSKKNENLANYWNDIIGEKVTDETVEQLKTLGTEFGINSLAIAVLRLKR